MSSWPEAARPELEFRANVPSGEHPAEYAYEKVLRSLPGSGATALIALNDELAVGALSAAAELGRDIHRTSEKLTRLANCVQPADGAESESAGASAPGLQPAPPQPGTQLQARTPAHRGAGAGRTPQHGPMRCRGTDGTDHRHSPAIIIERLSG